MESGLYDQLTQAGQLIPHEEVNLAPEAPQQAACVIRPERVAFISYPYEWSFSQLKDAALLTLAIEKKALEKGLSLKDASAYNIQFHHGRPVLIDTLSFEPYVEGRPWVAYRQFCQHFLAPLALMAYRDVRLSKLLRVYIDGSAARSRQSTAAPACPHEPGSGDAPASCTPMRRAAMLIRPLPPPPLRLPITTRRK